MQASRSLERSDSKFDENRSNKIPMTLYYPTTNTSHWRETNLTHIQGSKKALGDRKLRLEFAVEHVLYVFLFLVPLLRGEDLKHLNNPSKAPNAKAKSEKEAHLDGRI